MTVFLITGPPCAGKSTWVMDRVEPDDVVLDLDELCAALSPAREFHDSTQIVAHLAQVAADAVLAELRRTRPVGDVYVIRTARNAAGRQRLAHMLNARLVQLHVTHDECLSRARHDGRPTKTFNAIAAYFGTE